MCMSGFGVNGSGNWGLFMLYGCTGAICDSLEDVTHRAKSANGVLKSFINATTSGFPQNEKELLRMMSIMACGRMATMDVFKARRGQT